MRSLSRETSISLLGESPRRVRNRKRYTRRTSREFGAACMDNVNKAIPKRESTVYLKICLEYVSLPQKVAIIVFLTAFFSTEAIAYKLVSKNGE